MPQLPDERVARERELQLCVCVAGQEEQLSRLKVAMLLQTVPDLHREDSIGQSKDDTLLWYKSGSRCPGSSNNRALPFLVSFPAASSELPANASH